MDNIQMNKILKNCPVTSHDFQGVYNADEIPWEKQQQMPHQKSFFIFNLSDSDEEGTHWVCIMLAGYRTPIYFDSYGLEPNNPDFENFMENRYQFNSQPLQHPTTTNCGQWCMYFVFHMAQDLAFECMLKKFSRPLLQNDYLLSKCVRHIFKIDAWPLDLEYFKKRLRTEAKKDGVNSELIKLFLSESLRDPQLV